MFVVEAAKDLAKMRKGAVQVMGDERGLGLFSEEIGRKGKLREAFIKRSRVTGGDHEGIGGGHERIELGRKLRAKGGKAIPRAGGNGNDF